MKIAVGGFFAAAAAATMALCFSGGAVVNAINVGETVPKDLTLHHGFPPKNIDLDERMKGKNVLLVGLPGAFTPTWTNRQVPDYLANEQKLKDAGVDDVVIYCVNDAAVMQAWAESLNVPALDSDDKKDDGIIHMYADPYSLVTEKLDMELTASGPKMKGLVQRCKRFALYVVDGVVKIKRVAEADDDPAGDDRPDITLPEAMIAAIKAYNDSDGKSEL